MDLSRKFVSRIGLNIFKFNHFPDFLSKISFYVVQDDDAVAVAKLGASRNVFNERVFKHLINNSGSFSLVELVSFVEKEHNCLIAPNIKIISNQFLLTCDLTVHFDYLLRLIELTDTSLFLEYEDELSKKLFGESLFRFCVILSVYVSPIHASSTLLRVKSSIETRDAENLKWVFNQTNFKDSLRCSICFDDIIVSECKITACKHVFHIHCLNKWLKMNSSCPFCRSVFN